MLQRFFVHFSLITLFAFTQIGIVTHEISHFSDLAQQSQHDQNKPNHQCEQCLTHAGLTSGLIPQAFVFALAQTVLITTIYSKVEFFSTILHFYSSRAPPQLT